MRRLLAVDPSMLLTWWPEAAQDRTSLLYSLDIHSPEVHRPAANLPAAGAWGSSGTWLPTRSPSLLPELGRSLTKGYLQSSCSVPGVSCVGSDQACTTPVLSTMHHLQIFKNSSSALGSLPCFPALLGAPPPPFLLLLNVQCGCFCTYAKVEKIKQIPPC